MNHVSTRVFNSCLETLTWNMIPYRFTSPRSIVGYDFWGLCTLSYSPVFHYIVSFCYLILMSLKKYAMGSHRVCDDKCG